MKYSIENPHLIESCAKVRGFDLRLVQRAGTKCGESYAFSVGVKYCKNRGK